MGYKFTAIAPSSALGAAVKNFFIIEFNNDTPESDYLLPDGLPSFFYLQTDKPIDTRFGHEGQVVSLHEGLYIGYSNVAVRFTYTRSTIWGASVYPAYFSIIFGQSPLDIVNQFRRLEKDELLCAIRSTLSETGTFAAKVFERFEIYIARQLDHHFLDGNDVLKAFDRLTDSGEYCSRVEELAQSLGYSPRYLNSRFKRYFGMPPKQYIKLVRLNRALKCFHDWGKEKNLSFIAQEIDYHDQSHFIRDFKSICGKTPKEVLADTDSLANKFRLF
ncbi:MAG: helix-turn-helix transcriptional regulator [Breznakibacter sp.]